MNEGREQVYGTQMDGGGDEQPQPWPVEDPERLDECRTAMGLEPFGETRLGSGARRPSSPGAGKAAGQGGGLVPSPETNPSDLEG